MGTRWIYGHEQQRPRERDGFDPVAAGAGHGLSREVTLAIWRWACGVAGARGESGARERFHDLAGRVARSGGRLQPDVGATTRVDEEPDEERRESRWTDLLRPRVPGRDTLVRREARRAAAVGEVSGAGVRSAGSWFHSAAVAADGARAAGNLFRSAEASAGPSGSGRIAEALARALGGRGGGEPLPDALRREMEARLGADLRGVRIHTGAAAGAAARAVRARAFTTGEDIFFAPGAFDPASAAGRELIAHELMHVVQAQQGRLPEAAPGELRVSEPGDALEREAEAAGRAAVASTASVPVASAGFAWAGNGSCESAVRAARAVHPAGVLLRAPDPAGAEDPGVAAGPARVPIGGAQVNEIGIVARDHEPALQLRSAPSTMAEVVGTLPFNTRVQVMQRFAGDWLLVATLDGRTGFCARQHVWYAPAHRIPDPEARLHRVEDGKAGFAIHIAERYFGDAAKWGSDLRFYVGVLAAVNRLPLPTGTDDWKTVQFRPGTFLWIPGAGFARSLHGLVSSGSRSHELSSSVGMAGVLERIGELTGDLREAIRLSGKYIPTAVARHVEQSLVSVVESLMWMAVGAVALLAITTAIGTAIGALAGGVGAAPGAAAGFEVGMALLEWLGLGFLVAWIGSAVVRIGGAFAAFFGAVWNARGDREAIDRAAQAFAEAIGTLAGVFVEAMAMWAASVGVRAAIGKLRGTRLGQRFGEARLGQWLEQRVARHRAGESPLPGPRQALRQLLERRRRGERGNDEGKRPAPPADAWSELGQRHGLDDVVVEILRVERVDPAVADRLLAKGMDPFDLAELALDHGAEGVGAVDVMSEANVPVHVAGQALAKARDMGIARQVIELISSQRLENLPGLRNFLEGVARELARGQLGKYNQLMEARDRAMRGDRVGVEGRQHLSSDAESGKADVIDYTTRQAVQMKTVTSASKLAVLENLQSAIDQLGGETGELPPRGFQRIADVRIEGARNPLRVASRAQLLVELRGALSGLDNLIPDDAAPGIVRITNAISTFLFSADELR